jgi:hypothetical protein
MPKEPAQINVMAGCPAIGGQLCSGQPKSWFALLHQDLIWVGAHSFPVRS